MAKGGFPGMGGNMNNMMKQMQKVQKQMDDTQKEIEAREIEVTAGGGAIKAIVSGKREVISIEIDKDVVDPDDVEMLQDLIVAAVNEGLRKAEDMMSSEMKKLTGGLNIPGL